MFITRQPVRLLFDGSDGGGAGTAEAESQTSEQQTTQDDEPFDKDRALDTIKKQRAAEKAALDENKALKAKLKEIEDAEKSDGEKLAERTKAAETTASSATAEAARLRVALRKGLTETQAKRLVGETEEDLEKDADELLESFKPSDEQQDDDTRRRPKERLRSGATSSTEPEETDPDKLAAQVPRMY
jgi:hypothetical protein